MFYCDKCAERYQYPASIHKSYGPCEICGRLSTCNDIPRHLLAARLAHEEAEDD